MPKVKKVEEAKHDHPRDDKGCEQTVNLCCCDDKKLEYHYLEPKHEYCCYEVAMKRIRVLYNKNEALNQKAELMIAGYANQHSSNFPGLGCWFQIHEKWGWVNINKVIGEFKIKQGSTLVVKLGADIIEAGTKGEANFEIGSHQEHHHFELHCASGLSRKVIKVEAHGVKDTVSGSNRCGVEIEFVAYQKNCC